MFNVSEFCDTDTFDCGDGICVLNDVVCDGNHDCENGTDEIDCKLSVCSLYAVIFYTRWRTVDVFSWLEVDRFDLHSDKATLVTVSTL